MKNNDTAIFENSARRTLHFAVTSRWPDTLNSRPDEFMTPSSVQGKPDSWCLQVPGCYIILKFFDVDVIDDIGPVGLGST